MKICIDPGHGGKDTGASGFGIYEKDINLDISLKLEKLLKEKGYEVNLTRREDITLSAEKRVSIVNNYNSDIVISIHNNASSNSDANGSEVIYPYEFNNGKHLAELILDSLGELSLTKRRIYYRLNNNGENYYFMIRRISNLSLIVECAFISNYEDNQLLKNEDFRLKIAQAIFNGIINFRDSIFKDKHWAKSYFQRLKEEKLVLEEHDLNSNVTWAEFSTVISRLLDREE